MPLAMHRSPASRRHFLCSPNSNACANAQPRRQHTVYGYYHGDWWFTI